MESQPSEAFGPELIEAKETLQTALAQACSAEVENADTGQLIRVEEMLAIAGEAAKLVVSIRRRRGRDKRPRVTPQKGVARPAELPADVAPVTHRVFVDATGVRWDAFAVHPSTEIATKARLPEPYQSGWLSFDSGSERRRLSPVPESWRTMTDDALRELCARAELVPRRVTPPSDSPKVDS